MVENNTPRILIVGKLRSGKSLIARYLERKYNFHEVAFGDELKRSADRLFGNTEVAEYMREPIYRGGAEDVPFLDPNEIVGYRKPRRLYQDFGQLLRTMDENIWVRHAESMMESLETLRTTAGIVISDGRQPNEIEWAKRNGFVIIRVSANEDTRLARAEAEGDAFSLEDLRHGTEQHIDDYAVDYEVWNDGGDRAELERKIDEIMEGIV